MMKRGWGRRSTQRQKAAPQCPAESETTTKADRRTMAVRSEEEKTGSVDRESVSLVCVVFVRVRVCVLFAVLCIV